MANLLSNTTIGGYQSIHTGNVGSYALTSITSGQITTALGFTPYNATNPSAYITSSNNYYYVNPGSGYGLGFWGQVPTTYGITMANESAGYGVIYGLSEYHLYFSMTGGGNRGFVFRNDAHGAVTQIGAYGWQMWRGELYPGYNNATSGSQTSYYIYGNTNSGGIRTNGNWIVNGDIYLGTRDAWLSTYLNQDVRTSASPSFSTVNLSTLNASDTNARYYVQSTNGVPSNNLGNPTVTEMALFDEQFNNKTAFYDNTALSFWTSSDGTNYTEYTGFDTTTKKRFLGGDSDSGVYIPNLTNRFRIELENTQGYVFLNQLYIYWSSNSHSTKVHIWVRRCDNNQWYQWTDSNTQVSSWPGHLYLPFGGIPFYPGALASNGHYNRIRIEFIPSWSSGTYSYTNINLMRMQIWGGYPAGKRNIYSVDENRNVTFPTEVGATAFYATDFRAANAFYLNGTSYYLNSYNGGIYTNARFETAGNLVVQGNSYLGNGNGDEVHINDILRVGATDSGDAHFYFGEGGSAGSDYGSHWYWDSGYRFTWYTRNAGTDSTLFYYDTNSLSYITWGRSISMNTNSIDYTGQLHFSGGTRFQSVDTHYLKFKTDATDYGSIQVRDANETLRGHLGYFDANGFGLLNSSGSWGIRLNPGSAETLLFHAGNERLRTDSQGAYVTGRLDVSNYIYTPQHIIAKNIQGPYQVLNLDSIKEPGLYQYDGGIGGTQPAGTNWSNVKTIEIGSDNRYSQFVMPYSNSRIFYRIKIDAGWQSYVELVTSGNIGSQSVSYASTAGALSSMNISQFTNNSGYLTSLPSHNHDDRYYTETESDGRYAYKAGAAGQDFSVDKLSSYHLRNHYSVSTNHSYGMYFDNDLSTAYGIFRESGAWDHPYPDLRIAFHTGIKLGANSSYQGIKFYTDYDMVTQVMSVNNGSDPLGAGNVYVNNSLQAGSSLRAPIFYDTADTGYYGDFASTSVMNAIRFGTSTNSGTLSGNSEWGVRLTTNDGWIQFGPANTGHAHIYTDRTNFYFNRDLLVNGNTVITSATIGSQSVSYASTAGSLSSMNISQFTNNSGYITGYTETDTFASVTGRGATTASQVSFTQTGDHAISVGTIRGRAVGVQTGEFIQLYERVNIGGPSGWGASNTSAPTYGLSVYGGATIGYGNSAGLAVTGRITVQNGNDSGTLYGPNATWSAYLYVGAASNNVASTTAQVISTDGNLHIDSGSGSKQIYMNYYSGMVTGIYGGLNMQNTYITNASYIRSNTNIYTDQNYGYGLVGLYNASRYQGVFAMGDSYKLTADGTGTGNLYGLAWSHPNAGGQTKGGLEHQLLVMNYGVTQTAIGTGIWTAGLITTTSYGTSANWKSAYDWGNHASAGYQAASTAITTSNIGSQSVSYASSAGSVAWTNVSSRPTALSQFTNDLGNYGGFLTSITAHSHAISDVTGLQTALDGKQAAGSYAASSHTHDDRYYTESESDTRFARRDADSAISGNLVIGNGTYGNSTAYGNSGARLMFSGSDGDAQGNYYIGTNHNDYGGNYSKLELRWHTGIRMGAQPGYGGIRFYDTEDLGTVIFSVGTGDSHVRVVNNLYVGGNLALHAGNYNSYSPTLTGGNASGTWSINVTGSAGSAGSVAWTNVSSRPTNLSQFTNDLGNYGGWQSASTAITTSNIGSQSVSYASTAGSAPANGGNSSTVGGYAVSGSVGANTVVIRDSNGYIYAHYINSNVSESENPTINSFYTSNGDGWLRKSSVAHVKSQLGLGSLAYSSATIPTNNNQLTNGAGYITGINSGNVTTALGFTPYNATNPSGYITSSASISGNAATATNVAWTGVTSRPTALSQFSNDLGNYGGWLTTGGKAADSELLDGIDSGYFVRGNGVNTLGYRTTNHTGGNSAGGLSSGFYDGSGMSNMPTSDWYHLIVNSHYNSATNNQYEFQLATAFWNKSDFFVRSISPGDVGPWRTLVHNGNIGSQSVSYATTSQQLNKYGDISGQDWNTYYINGKMIVSSVYGGSGPNFPTGAYNYGAMLSYGVTGSEFFQVYFPENGALQGGAFRKLHYRTGWNGSWSAWKSVVDQEGQVCTIAGSNQTGIEIHSNVGYNQDPLTYFLMRGQADTSWKAFKVRLTGDAGGQDIEFRRIAENGTDSRMWYVPRGGNTVNFDYPIVQPSDSRLKDNITPISTPVDKIKSLHGVEFDWNSGEQVGTHDVGLIAQDVEAVLPEAVTTQEDGYKNLAYTKVIPLLVEAMKEQQAMIEALRAEIELLKAR